MAKAGTVPGLHPEPEAEMDVAAAVGAAAADGTAAAVAGKAAVAPCRQQAAGFVLPQSPCAH